MKNENAEGTVKDSLTDLDKIPSNLTVNNFNNLNNNNNLSIKDKKNKNDSDRLYSNNISQENLRDKDFNNIVCNSMVNYSLTDYYYCWGHCCNVSQNQLKHCQIASRSLIEKGKNNKEKNAKNNLNNVNSEIECKMSTSHISLDKSCLNLDNGKLKNLSSIPELYKNLIIDFSNTNNLKGNDKHIQSQIIACNSLQFLFMDDFNLILKFFNYSLEVMKFFIYQIYLFLSIIYIDENSELTDCIEMSYRTILLYSAQNFELLLKFLLNTNSKENFDSKAKKSLTSKNKILFSILKTILPKNKIDNNFYKDISFNLLDEIQYEKKNNEISTRIKKNIYSKFMTFLSEVKSNQSLFEKMENITKKSAEDFLNIDNNYEDNNKSIDDIENIDNNNNDKYHLNEFDKNKYQYTIFIELDETLVHYYEDDNNYFVKVRCGTEDFLRTINEFCEIIIVSTSSKEYTDLIVQNINKENNYVDHTIYKELFDINNESLDLTLFNRDINKCFFICHEDNFFNAPKENIIKLSEFKGEESDRELVYLQLELMKLPINNNIEDAKTVIPNILLFIEEKRINEANDENK